MLRIIDHDPVRELRLEYPPVNALRWESLEALREAVESAVRNKRIRSLMISGMPEYFSAGLDVRHQIEAGQEAADVVFHELFALLRAIGTSPLPIAAAITGHSVGGGALLAIYCDYRIMADGDFNIGLPEVRIGLPIPPVIYTALSRLIGPRMAERLCVEGTLMSSQAAQRIGLVDRLAPPSAVVAATLTWCQEMGALPPRALRLTRAAARRELAHAFAEFGWEELDELAAGWSGEETQKALRRWLDRRATPLE